MTDEADPLPEVVVRPEAEAEIAEAYRWYESKVEGLGLEFLRALDASLSTIQRHPSAYAAVHKQMRRAVLRRFPYSVIYLSENDTIIVLACFHASRDPKLGSGKAGPERGMLRLIKARLVFVHAAQIVLRNVLGLLGVSAPERM